MLKSIEEAAGNFCIHQIRSPYILKNGQTTKQVLIAYIDINTQEHKKYRIYLAADEEFIQQVAQLFLEEQESDEETLRDMLLELANLIVGSAKVVAQESDAQSYTIETPHFLKTDRFDLNFDDAITLQTGEKELTIAIKELDA